MPNDINVIYTPLKSTCSGLQFCCCQYWYIYIRSCYCLQKLQNDMKFRENSNLQQFKVIQSHCLPV